MSEVGDHKSSERMCAVILVATIIGALPETQFPTCSFEEGGLDNSPAIPVREIGSLLRRNDTWSRYRRARNVGILYIWQRTLELTL